MHTPVCARRLGTYDFRHLEMLNGDLGEHFNIEICSQGERETIIFIEK